MNRILHEGQFTAIELAAEGGVSDRLIGYHIAGEKPLRVDVAERISRYLCRHGETRYAATFLSPDWAVCSRAEGVADGCVQSEITAIVEALADASRGHRDRDVDTLDSAIAGIKAALTDLEAERRQLS